MKRIRSRLALAALTAALLTPAAWATAPVPPVPTPSAAGCPALTRAAPGGYMIQFRNVQVPPPGLPFIPHPPVFVTRAMGASAPTPGGVVGELIAILNETSSRDTYLVTVTALTKLGAEAKSAAPAIIRNAERLGLLTGSTRTSPKQTNRQKAAEMVFDALEEVLNKDGRVKYSACPASCQPSSCAKQPTSQKSTSDSPCCPASSY